MLIVAVNGVVPVLIAVKLGMVLVVPEVGVRPTVLLFMDQLYVEELTVELKMLAEITLCGQTVTLVKFCIRGFGFTVMVNVTGVPEHPFAEGVTTTVLT